MNDLSPESLRSTPHVPAWALDVVEEDPELDDVLLRKTEEDLVRSPPLSGDQVVSAWKRFVAYLHERNALQGVDLCSMSKDGNLRERNIWARWVLWMRTERRWLRHHGK